MLTQPWVAPILPGAPFCLEPWCVYHPVAPHSQSPFSRAPGREAAWGHLRSGSRPFPALSAPTESVSVTGLFCWSIQLVTCCLRRSFTSPSSWFSCDICPKNCRLKSPIGTAEGKEHQKVTAISIGTQKQIISQRIIMMKNSGYENLTWGNIHLIRLKNSDNDAAALVQIPMSYTNTRVMKIPLALDFGTKA